MALAGSLWGKQIENARVEKCEFLSKLDLSFRGWKHKDFPLSKDEVHLLEPDDVIIRRFESEDGRNGAELAVIAGHRKRTVHTPGFCMAGSGWDVVTQHNRNLNIEGRTIQVSEQLMSSEKAKVKKLVTFFFSDGNFTTASLSRFQFKQLMKRFSSGVPIGALVRIIVPVEGSDAKAARQQTNEFAMATLPQVLEALRTAKLKTY